jgi:hypothetical protein
MADHFFDKKSSCLCFPFFLALPFDYPHNAFAPSSMKQIKSSTAIKGTVVKSESARVLRKPSFFVFRLFLPVTMVIGGPLFSSMTADDIQEMRFV